MIVNSTLLHLRSGYRRRSAGTRHCTWGGCDTCTTRPCFDTPDWLDTPSASHRTHWYLRQMHHTGDRYAV